MEQPRSNAVVTMKLDSEDYENIYLRVRDKLVRFWVAMFSALGGAGLLVAYLSFSSSAERAVTRYVQTDAFKASVADLASSRMTSLEQRARDLEVRLQQAERRAASTSGSPVSITDHGLSLISSTSARFNIENGEAGLGERIKFATPFSKRPAVILIPMTNRSGIENHPILGRNVTQVLTVLDVTSSGFNMPVGPGLRRYAWLAIGQ